MAGRTGGMLKVVGDDPRAAVAPMYANFVAVCNVGGDVQFEFIFLDLNELAQRIQLVRKGEESPDGELQGKTVAKLVVPAASFMQLKDHLAAMFESLGEQYGPKQEETSTERGYGN